MLVELFSACSSSSGSCHQLVRRHARYGTAEFSSCLRTARPGRGCHPCPARYSPSTSDGLKPDSCERVRGVSSAFFSKLDLHFVFLFNSISFVFFPTVPLVFLFFSFPFSSRFQTDPHSKQVYFASQLRFCSVHSPENIVSHLCN
jgi:hypothetical protein